LIPYFLVPAVNLMASPVASQSFYLYNINQQRERRDAINFRVAKVANDLRLSRFINSTTVICWIKFWK